MANLGPSHDLAARPWEDLEAFPIFPGTTLGSTPIEIPRDWVGGKARHRCNRLIDPTLDGRLRPESVPADAMRVEAIRRCLLALWMTKRTEIGSHLYKPSTWAQVAKIFLRLVAWTLDHPAHPNDRPGVLFATRSIEDIVAMVQGVGAASEGVAVRAMNIVRYLAEAGERGALSDYPRWGVKMIGGAPAAGQAEALVKAAAGMSRVEKALAGVNVPWRTPTEEERSGVAFPDEFVTALIGGAIWVQRNIADLILECLERVHDRKAGVVADDPDARADLIGKKQLAVIKAFRWRYPNGRDIERSDVEDAFGGAIAMEWPPRTKKGLEKWAVVLQGLNVQVLAFCTGARSSEVGAANDDAVVGDDGDARFESLTFKTVQDLGGRMRDWPLHPAGVEAMQRDNQGANSASIRMREALGW